MKSFFATTLLIALIATFSTVQAADKQCKAYAYYHKKVAYNSGIYFHHGKKAHEGIYGSFWDGVNETETKNIGLKRRTMGYDKDMVGYLWGNALEYGYIGGGKGYVLGLQTAIGSLAGLLTEETERAFTANLEGASKGTWNGSSGLPMIATPNGASTVAAMESVLNRTQIEQQHAQTTPENDDDNADATASAIAAAALKAALPSEQQQQTRGITFDAESSVEWNNAKRSDDDEEECDDEDADANDNDDDDEDCEDDEGQKGFKNGPEKSAVYHAPWRTSKPVYFYGQCDTCDKKTGFNKNGHGSLQSCSLIYYGKEYFGKPTQTDDMYMCVVDFDC